MSVRLVGLGRVRRGARRRRRRARERPRPRSPRRRRVRPLSPSSRSPSSRCATSPADWSSSDSRSSSSASSLRPVSSRCPSSVLRHAVVRCGSSWRSPSSSPARRREPSSRSSLPWSRSAERRDRAPSPASRAGSSRASLSSRSTGAAGRSSAATSTGAAARAGLGVRAGSAVASMAAGGSGGRRSTTIGADTAVAATPATTPAFANVAAAPAPPVPVIRDAIRMLSDSSAAAPAAQLTSGRGATAVAAARSDVRARWTSWRTAIRETPSSSNLVLAAPLHRDAQQRLALPRREAGDRLQRLVDHFAPLGLLLRPAATLSISTSSAPSCPARRR